MSFPLHLVAGLELSTLPQQIVNGVLLGTIYALIALGYTMVYGVLKLINFAHGEVFMLGAYASLFMSWWLGYTPQSTMQGSSFLNLALMLLASMTFCALVGVIIERFAYRPIRNQPRISALITAIGLSLLLQYGGQIFLLNGVQQSIDQRVNPYQGDLSFDLRSADPSVLKEAEVLRPAMEAASRAFEARLPQEKSRFNLSPEGEALKKLADDAKRSYQAVVDRANSQEINVAVSKGKLTMLVTTIVLMGLLTYLVMFTRRGRAMRAVSHDFNASALMGIDVNQIITFTFILGSAAAGAGAMMYVTFQPGTKIDPFLGLAPGIKAFTAAVLGGIGNIPGAVLGGLLMGIAENAVIWIGYDQYRDAVAFVILIVVLLFRPGGLLGSSKVEKV
ncbi:MAG: branched-chain amino acid ABC transporter permease [Fimbriimonadaceae bacterium]